MNIEFSTSLNIACSSIYFFCFQVGGATGLVGDPSGRNKERDVMISDKLEKNKAGLRENLTRIFHNAATHYSQHLPSPSPQLK